MNEVKKCSISGVGFTLNTDAYEALERYLESLKQTYRENPDGDRSSPTSRHASPN